MPFTEAPYAQKLSSDQSLSNGQTVNGSRAESPDNLADVVDIYLQQAAAYYDESQWDKAIAACNRALELAPETASAYKMLGNVLQRQGKLTDAMGFYAEALARHPSSPEIYSNLGSLYARKQGWEQAITYFQKAIDKDPNFATAYINLAKVWKKLSKSDQELACLQRAFTLQPELGSAQSHYRVAQSLEAAKESEAAIAAYRQTIERSPDFLPAYERLIELLEDKGDWQPAAVYYRKVVELTAQKSVNSEPNEQTLSKRIPSADESHTRVTSNGKTNGLVNQHPVLPAKAKINLSRRDQHLVKNLLQASSKKQLIRPVSSTTVPSTIPAAQLGARYANAKDWPRAIHHLKQALQADPKSAALYRTIAALLARNNQPRQAAMAWYRAFALEPSWPNAEQYVQVGDALFEQGKLKAAVHCYRGAIRAQPNFGAAYHQLAKLLRSQGDLEMSEAVLRRLASVTSNSAANLTLTGKLADRQDIQQQALKLHQQGETLQKEGDWEGAIATYQKAIALNPTSSWSHHNTGDCYKALGKWKESVEAYQQAIAYKADFVWSHYSLAEVYRQLGDWENSARFYNQVIQLDPDNQQVRPRLMDALQELMRRQPRNIELYEEAAKLHVYGGRIDEAIDTYQMALQIRPDAPDVAKNLADLLQPIDPDRSAALIAQSEQMLRTQIDCPEDLKDNDSVRQLLSATNLFDFQYYRRQGVDGSPSELLEHYLKQPPESKYRPNPLFDNQYYLSKYPEVARLRVNPLAHYYIFGYLQGYDPHPLFSTQFYLENNPDVAAATINPLNHYLGSGAKLGRKAFETKRLTMLLDDIDLTSLRRNLCRTSTQELIQSSKKKIGLYTSSQGNTFLSEISNFIAAALKLAGHEITRLSEKDTPSELLHEHWVVAPHEFFRLKNSGHLLEQQAWLEKTTLINTEQPQTKWFAESFHFMRHARQILDINPQTAFLLRNLGLPANWLPLGYIENYKPLTAEGSLPDVAATRSLSVNVREYLPKIEDNLDKRLIDILFVGTLSPRREAFFVENSTWLHQYKCFLHLPPSKTFSDSSESALHTQSAIGVSRRSKILLNIHRDNIPYFEWHRLIFYGLWQQTLVVTEPCYTIPGLVPDEHFIVCQQEEMHQTIDWLLNSAEGQMKAEQVRRAGHRALVENFEISEILQAVEGSLEK